MIRVDSGGWVEDSLAVPALPAAREQVGRVVIMPLLPKDDQCDFTAKRQVLALQAAIRREPYRSTGMQTAIQRGQ
jgi:hypothetical protein